MSDVFFRNSKELGELKRLADVLEASTKDAAEAATIARESVVAAKRSAFWTMVAAIVAALGMVFSAAATLGWLDWSKREIMQQPSSSSVPSQTTPPSPERSPAPEPQP